MVRGQGEDEGWRMEEERWIRKAMNMQGEDRVGQCRTQMGTFASEDSVEWGAREWPQSEATRLNTHTHTRGTQGEPFGEMTAARTTQLHSEIVNTFQNTLWIILTLLLLLLHQLPWLCLHMLCNMKLVTLWIYTTWCLSATHVKRVSKVI